MIYMLMACIISFMIIGSVSSFAAAVMKLLIYLKKPRQEDIDAIFNKIPILVLLPFLLFSGLGLSIRIKNEPIFSSLLIHISVGLLLGYFGYHGYNLINFDLNPIYTCVILFPAIVFTIYQVFLLHSVYSFQA
jgi:hypothetical protein